MGEGDTSYTREDDLAKASARGKYHLAIDVSVDVLVDPHTRLQRDSGIVSGFQCEEGNCQIGVDRSLIGEQNTKVQISEPTARTVFGSARHLNGSFPDEVRSTITGGAIFTTATETGVVGFEIFAPKG